MTVDARAFRATVDRSASERIREKAERDLERVRKSAAEIRRMTDKLYQDRLDGRHDRQP